jgi:hypothetical protein
MIAQSAGMTSGIGRQLAFRRRSYALLSRFSRPKVWAKAIGCHGERFGLRLSLG